MFLRRAVSTFHYIRIIQGKELTAMGYVQSGHLPVDRKTGSETEGYTLQINLFRSFLMYVHTKISEAFDTHVTGTHCSATSICQLESNSLFIKRFRSIYFFEPFTIKCKSACPTVPAELFVIVMLPKGTRKIPLTESTSF